MCQQLEKWLKAQRVRGSKRYERHGDGVRTNTRLSKVQLLFLQVFQSSCSCQSLFGVGKGQTDSDCSISRGKLTFVVVLILFLVISNRTQRMFVH